MPEHGMTPVEDVGEDIPLEVLESILRDHLGNESARVTSHSVKPSPLQAQPTNAMYQVQIAWAADEGRSGGSAEWLVKRWRPGDLNEAWMGIAEPLEALAWDHGLPRPEPLPPGISTPFVGASLGTSAESAWVAMTDVSAELGEYDGTRPLPPGEAVVRAKCGLDGLARLHGGSSQSGRRYSAGVRCSHPWTTYCGLGPLCMRGPWARSRWVARPREGR
jgi:hypothetical protein